MNNRKHDTWIWYAVSFPIEKNLIGKSPIRFFEWGNSSFLAIYPLAHLVDAIFEYDGIHRVDEWGIFSVLPQDGLDDVVFFDYGFKLGLSVPWSSGKYKAAQGNGIG